MTAERGFTDRFFYKEQAHLSGGLPGTVADAILFGNTGEEMIRLVLPDLRLLRAEVNFPPASNQISLPHEDFETDSVQTISTTDNPIDGDNQEEATALSFDTEAVMTFEDWLSTAGQSGNFSPKKDENTDSDDLKLLDKQIQLEIPFQLVSNMLEKETHYAGDLSLFLQTEKQKKRPVRRRSGGQQDEKVITETMARVLAAQGNVEGAIDVYNRLILKNPSKKGIFAVEIEKLKTQR